MNQGKNNHSNKAGNPLTFKDFVYLVKDRNQPLLTVNNNHLSLTETSTNSLSKKISSQVSTISDQQAYEFALGVNSLLKEEKTLDLISDRVGFPYNNESEDEFVNRAKMEITLALYELMDKK
ncbi:hypothetical protein ACRU1U_20045 [Providencia stuartii]|uniref:hypothetical protein n=1 Tax=Providencia stuartii TaxID=588 RepID=UPI002882B01C|nr:hypothetical protein [Providencia stuartii]MDK7737742.1 hypothetical protein [Providencia stuartii]WRV52719.1 hypothetical protein VQ573_04325 [Providencia stuartii]HEM8345718.1 hypothetical protein [Providencia stuartii]